MFQYLKHPTIWSKFQETSKLIAETLEIFDTTYAWNDKQEMLQRPTRAPGEPRAGLRDLYCFWIDQYLGMIDVNAAAWVTSARTRFEQLYGGSPGGRKWIADAFGNGGLVTAAEMQLTKSAQVPVSPGQLTLSSRYGVWAGGPAGPW